MTANAKWESMPEDEKVAMRSRLADMESRGYRLRREGESVDEYCARIQKMKPQIEKAVKLFTPILGRMARHLKADQS